MLSISPFTTSIKKVQLGICGVRLLQKTDANEVSSLYSFIKENAEKGVKSSGLFG